jgi:hypothetical protein
MNLAPFYGVGKSYISKRDNVKAMNSSSGLVTLGLMLLKPTLIGLGGSQVFQGLMWSDEVLNSVPFLELKIMGLDARFDVLDLIKLFPVRPVRPFDIALQISASVGG